MTGRIDEELLQMRDIHYSYGMIPALNGADFQLMGGEFHALVGDHRAGKSTLVKILSGALRCRRGEIILPSGVYTTLSPAKALNEGIGIVSQEESLVPSLNAVDNIFSGHYRLSALGVIKYRSHLTELQEFCSGMGMDIELNRPVGQLDKVRQHLIEFLRAIYFDPTILILDEISIRFTPREMDLIYTCILRMKKAGKGIIYISHDMDEVMEFADRVTILKDGRCRKTENINNLDKMQLYYMTYSQELSRKELRQANLELYNFKKYNEAIIRNIPVGVIILDESLSIYQVNEIAEKIFDRTEKGELEFEQFLSGLESDKKALIRHALGERRRLHLEEIHYGRERVYDILCAPFSGDADNCGTIVLIDDKTEDHKVRDYIRRTEQISSIAEMAAGVAHEINNPLNIILNYMDLLSIAIDDEPSVNRLKKIEKEIQRITEITGSLLSFSRVKDIEMTECDLRKVLQEALLLLKYRIEKCRVMIVSELPEHPVPIMGNFNKLEQVFINLLVNSLDVLSPGGEIRIRIGEERETVVATVSDTGPGIEGLVLKKIFEPFFTTKLEGKNCGLGLSVCMHIMSEHGGTIDCVSEQGLTTFRLRFPCNT